MDRKLKRQEKNIMSRILPAEPDHNDARTADILKAVKIKLGILPNLFATVDFPVVHLSPAA